MLTIREPISLRSQRPIQSIRQDMAERLQANYGMMKMPIRKEELLHITSEPPEVYFAEGDEIQIFNQIKNENQQEVRLDVINNLINRIMVAQTDNFTYQDTVYISTVLRKLGIRDEKTFMKQVFALQKEHKETRRLLQKYENNQEILQMLFAEQAEGKRAEDKPAELLEGRENRYYLHDEIFKRLETGRIYQDLRAYTKGVRHESQQIFRNEFSVGEQAAMVQQFHLHQLKQKLTRMEMPLTFFHHNQYEYLQENLEEWNQTLEEQISAAILLNLTNQSYSLRQQQIEENSHNWYSVAGALFQTAENTWKRYEANLTENKRISSQTMQMLEEVNEVKRLEGDTIQKIAEEYHTLNQEWKRNTELQQMTLQQRNIQEGGQQEINLSGGSYHLTQEELQLQFLRQEEEAEEQEAPAAITAEQLQRQLEVFNQRNFENYQKLTEIEKQRPRMKERKLDRRKARQDALRALENPREVLMEFITTEVHDPVVENQQRVEAQIYDLFSEETKEIYRQFLRQNRSQETTFLQHVMAQPTESEVRQEVLHAVEQVQQQAFIKQIEKQFAQQVEVQQPVISQTINQEIRQQMTNLQELQSLSVYQQWNLPTAQILQQEKEKEVLLLQHMQANAEETTLEREHILQAAAAETLEKGPEAVERHTLVHPARLRETEEVFLTEEKETILHRQEQRLEEVRQTIEKRLQKHQQERIVETASQQEVFRQVGLVHKAEEQLMTEELLETIRSQQQKVRKEEHTEETTLQQNQIQQTTVQNTVNRMHVNQIDDIDELVQQTVRKQINHLSDQVYGKIEKKLATERKRRGYK